MIERDESQVSEPNRHIFKAAIDKVSPAVLRSLMEEAKDPLAHPAGVMLTTEDETCTIAVGPDEVYFRYYGWAPRVLPNEQAFALLEEAEQQSLAEG